MALDLSTYSWTHISGISEPDPKLGEPDFRTDPAMWAVPSERRIYILQGSARRGNAYLRKDPLGYINDHTYGDLWSYHVDEREWRREKLRGNYASPRTEMAYCWAPSLQRAVVYGGYNASMPTMDDSKAPTSVSPLLPGSMFQYAYFGDAFLFDPVTRLWQHVLVKGFPSYRAGSSFVCDPDDGKLYMFGGYTNAQYVPANRNAVRMYCDLWQLKIDLPGGCWNPKDLERDIRLERAGPWMRCFTCGNCGLNWQKCGGTCGGKLYFCSRECLKNGWREHKEVHGCRKRA
ncbi:hypothetical protein AURDEDRAFT_60834 [Auricularia subglabra TFB-10046 SS5]|nr:hypothetical protein AURDEDRAFT_60834 [Auricularia subglabra TFB-10046 SS5]